MGWTGIELCDLPWIGFYWWIGRMTWIGDGLADLSKICIGIGLAMDWY